MRPLAIVLNYRKSAKSAFNVLAGSLELDPATRDVLVRFVTRERDLATAIEEELALAERVLVAWSFYSPDFSEEARVLAAVRRRVGDPRVVHLVGGVHATAEPLLTAAAGFDLVATGEGERTIQEVVKRLIDGRDPRAVRGIVQRDGTHRKPEPIDLNDFPPIARAHRRIGAIEITRGCIYACKFCQTPFMNRARFRHRTVANALGWVRVLRDLDARDYRFITPTSMSYGAAGTEPDLDAVEALLGGARSIIGPDRRLFYGTFPSEIRPEHVTPRALELLRRYVDNRSIIVGGQSGSERLLAESKRGHGVPEIERAVAVAREHGFEPHVDFIFGLPGEEAADVEATLALMARLTEAGARVHGHVFMPLPGTPFRDAPPGTVARETQRVLDLLASRGKLYGHWKTQLGVARELVQLRGTRPT